MKYVAHRGISKKHEDNTVPAIKEALDREYYGIEIDVQLCKTGEIVVYHDMYITEGFINELTFDELKSVGICSLHEIYDTLPGIRDVVLIVDIKGNNPLIAFALQEFYQDEDTSKVYFSSFNRKLVRLLPSNFNPTTLPPFSDSSTFLMNLFKSNERKKKPPLAFPSNPSNQKTPVFNSFSIIIIFI